jgi:hypothetical protein
VTLILEAFTSGERLSKLKLFFFIFYFYQNEKIYHAYGYHYIISYTNGQCCILALS